jgi:site-specific DNA-methyltransferase (adenine-specific)
VLVTSNLKMFKYDLVWEKAHPKGHLNAKKQPLRAHESICIFYTKLPVYNPQKTIGHKRRTANNIDRANKQSEVYGVQKTVTNYDSTERYPRSVLYFASDMQTCNLHPTQKPVALMEYLIKTYSNEGETVLDFCMGSGTTGVACKNLNRDFIGIEKEENYFNIAKERIKLWIGEGYSV